MPTFFDIALKGAWLSVLVYWLWSAHRVKAPTKTEPLAKRLLAYWLPLVVALLLLGPGRWFGHTALREQFVPHTLPVYVAGLALAVAGAALAIRARHLLGGNWSGTVQLKQDHQLIDAGPYRFVRHPIYSGLLLLFLGNAVLVGDWRGLLAVAIVFLSFWFKLRLEEKWLAQHFGDAWRDYARRTKALVPAIL